MAEQTTAAAAATSGEQRLPMSYEAFLALDDEAIHAEWVDGEALIFVPPKTVHQLLSDFLARLFGLYVDLGSGGARNPRALSVLRG